MPEKYCPDCGAVMLPHTTKCPGCGRSMVFKRRMFSRPIQFNSKKTTTFLGVMIGFILLGLAFFWGYVKEGDSLDPGTIIGFAVMVGLIILKSIINRKKKTNSDPLDKEVQNSE